VSAAAAAAAAAVTTAPAAANPKDASTMTSSAFRSSGSPEAHSEAHSEAHGASQGAMRESGTGIAQGYHMRDHHLLVESQARVAALEQELMATRDKLQYLLCVGRESCEERLEVALRAGLDYDDVIGRWIMMM
jgi:hypothetical protein